MSIKSLISFVSVLVVSLWGVSNGFQCQLHDIGVVRDEKSGYPCVATSINNKRQIGGIICHTSCWFTWSNGKIKRIPINLRKAGGGGACPPYVNNLGNLSLEYLNDAGQYATVEESNLYIVDKGSKRLLDNTSKWFLPELFHFKINNKQEIAGLIRRKNGLKQAAYFNAQTGVKKLLPIKPACYVTSINDLGDIVGWFSFDGKMNSFLWNPSTDHWQIIKNFRAAAINNNRVIVGVVRPPGGSPKGAFWGNGVLTVLDDVLNFFSDMSTDIESIVSLNDINDHNDMVGCGITHGNSLRIKHAILIKRSNSLQPHNPGPITLIIDPKYEKEEYERLSLECSRITERYSAMGSRRSSAYYGEIVNYLKGIGTLVAKRVLKAQVDMKRIPAKYFEVISGVCS